MPRTNKGKLKSHFLEELEDVAMGIHYEMAHGTATWTDRTMEQNQWMMYIAAALALAKHGALRVVCRVLGHKIEDTSSGGPESGQISGYCERCGWSYHQTLY